MNTTISNIQTQIEELANREILVETNDGTYGAQEACRCVGTGDPAFATYRVYQRVGGGKPRIVGCDRERAPGYARHFRDELVAAQRELAKLRKAAEDEKSRSRNGRRNTP